MATVLGTLAELGYGWAYRVLDAQFFGVAQRRRRVFIVGCLGDRAGALSVLFEPESCDGDSPPSRETGSRVAGTLAASAGAVGQSGAAISARVAVHERVSVSSETGHEWWDEVEQIAPIAAHEAKEPHHLVAFSIYPESGQGADLVATPTDLAPTISATDGAKTTERGVRVVAYRKAQRAHDSDDCERWEETDRTDTLDAIGHTARTATAVLASPGGYSDSRADAEEARSGAVLRVLREEVGEEAFVEWCLGVLVPLRTPEVLPSEVHGDGVHWAIPEQDPELVHNAQTSAGHLSTGTMLEVREILSEGRPPPGRRPPEQLADQLDTYLSFLSHEGALRTCTLHGMWQASEGLGPVRQALSEVQAVGRSTSGENESAQGSLAVRRLTPLEVERLQGFPDDWTSTLNDSARYRTLGNAVCVPVAEWIGRRMIQQQRGTK